MRLALRAQPAPRLVELRAQAGRRLLRLPLSGLRLLGLGLGLGFGFGFGFGFGLGSGLGLGLGLGLGVRVRG